MAQKKRIIVIGGSAAGPKSAAKARRIDNDAEVIILQKEADLSMASCGYPYYVGGYFDDRNALLCTPTGVVRNPLFYLNAKDIDARVNTEVTNINTKDHSVSFTNAVSGETGTLTYDKLIIATGAVPRMPPVPGTDFDGITTLQSMKDADFLRKIRDEERIKKAVVIGGGLIGIETCEALQLAGIEITVIELLPQLLTFLDWELAKLVENHVKSKGANIITENGIAAFLGEDGKLTAVKLQNGTELPCELAVVAIGVRPNIKLAKDAGLKIGELGGIEVNEYMQTSDPDIYAVGDCVETLNRITGRKVHAPYGDLANLQGRIAGENAASTNCVAFPEPFKPASARCLITVRVPQGFRKRLPESWVFRYRDRHKCKSRQARLYGRKATGHQAGGGSQDRPDSRRTVYRTGECRQTNCPVGHGHSGENDCGRSCQRRSSLCAAIFPCH